MMVGKDLLELTSEEVNNPHCTKHLQYFLPFLCKIQANGESRFIEVPLSNDQIH